MNWELELSLWPHINGEFFDMTGMWIGEQSYRNLLKVGKTIVASILEHISLGFSIRKLGDSSIYNNIVTVMRIVSKLLPFKNT